MMATVENPANAGARSAGGRAGGAGDGGHAASVRLWVDEGEDLSGHTFALYHLCEDCAANRSNAHEPVVPLPCVSADSCEDCGAPSEAADRQRILLADYGDNPGGEPLGNVYLRTVAFPMEVCAEVAHREVVLPNERSLVKWAHKQFHGFEIHGTEIHGY